MTHLVFCTMSSGSSSTTSIATAIPFLAERERKQTKKKTKSPTPPLHLSNYKTSVSLYLSHIGWQYPKGLIQILDSLGAKAFISIFVNLVLFPYFHNPWMGIFKH